MVRNVLYFYEIDKKDLPYVGGKGANLGEMTNAGFPVPRGFCVSTQAFRAFIQTSREMNEFFRLLDQIHPDDLEQIRILGNRIREHLKSLSMPEDIKASILEAWAATGKNQAYAVRSSATAEDLPTASFAGQQETFLNVLGSTQLLQAVQNCWSSLFTDRAISYRAKNGFSHRSVYLSVVVQEMVFPEVSGIMFTSDPITGHRKTISIDASFGLGEALVSGIVTADLYQVRATKIIKKQISNKKVAIYTLPEGGTVTKNLSLEKQEEQALPDYLILELANLGKKVEAHYGSEQDIEWGLVKGRFYILQSRPITSLFPIPLLEDEQFHVFISFGHIQMMTEAMKPLALSLFRNIPNFLKKDPSSPDYSFLLAAGGRAFADVTGALSLKPSRKLLFKVFRGMDEFIESAISEVITREEFRNFSLPKKKVFWFVRKMAPIIIPVMSKVLSNFLYKDPEKARNYVNRLMENIVRENEEYILEAVEAHRIRRIKERMGNMVPNVLAKIVPYLITGVFASGSLKKKLIKKVGEKQGAYLLSQLNKSLPGNVTTELGLALGDLADMARKFPDVIDYLEQAKGKSFYKELLNVRGGVEFKQELEIFLKKYGMRCPGEIDISKPRWKEDPTQLVPSILSHIRTTAPGEHREKYKRGEIEAEQAAKEILGKFGFFERGRIARLLKLYRNLMGLREHHKFLVITLMDLYKGAIVEEARILVEKGTLEQEQDIFYFNLEELIGLIENPLSVIVQEIVQEREKQQEWNHKLVPPRVMTSDGEIITGKPRDVNAPVGALIGIPVSAGVVEGIARVIHRMEDAKLNPGEILVAPYTDPGWTPLFTSAVGLITEVGGMMTHGSVVAREYGIPAVVGVDKATEKIKDGAFIRVNGTEGFIEILSTN